MKACSPMKGACAFMAFFTAAGVEETFYYAAYSDTQKEVMNE